MYYHNNVEVSNIVFELLEIQREFHIKKNLFQFKTSTNISKQVEES